MKRHLPTLYLIVLTCINGFILYTFSFLSPELRGIIEGVGAEIPLLGRLAFGLNTYYYLVLGGSFVGSVLALFQKLSVRQTWYLIHSFLLIDICVLLLAFWGFGISFITPMWFMR